MPKTTTGQYVYRLDCGEVFAGPKGLPEGAQAGCSLHGPARIAGFGMSMFAFLHPGLAVPAQRHAEATTP